jgi:hypothetical protein
MTIPHTVEDVLAARPTITVAGCRAIGRKPVGTTVVTAVDVPWRDDRKDTATAKPAPMWRGDLFLPGMFGARFPGGRDPVERLERHPQNRAERGMAAPRHGKDAA